MKNMRTQEKAERRKDSKTKAVKILGGFFVMALIFTYLSRFASAAITPKVKCDTAGKGTIIHREWNEDGELIAEEESRMYDYCLPVSAIRIGPNGSCYVLVTDVKKTILGETLYAKRIGIEIEDSDDSNCAFKSDALTYDMQVIIESDKKIEAGDTIRLMEK